MKIISFVIPVYRNEGSIAPTYEKVKQLFGSKLSSYQYEFIFTDDGSDDNSLNELLNIKKRDQDRVKILSFSRNFGQASAEIAGFREVSGDAGIRMSADLQEPVEKITTMVNEWEKGAEIVICYRSGRSDNFFARVTSAIFYRIIKLFMPQMPKGGFDFVLMDKKPLQEFNKIDERNRFIQGDLLWLGFDVKYIPYERLKRPIGKSQWTFSKKYKYFMDGLINTSLKCLRIMFFTGLSIIFAGFAYTGITAYRYLVNGIALSKWSVMAISFLLVSGVVFTFMGLMGELIWRVHDETRKRPNYIIRKKYE